MRDSIKRFVVVMGCDYVDWVYVAFDWCQW